MKSSNIREGIFDIICTAVKSHGHAQRAALKVDQALTYHEHLSEHMAELLHRLSEKYSSQQLGEDVVREIAGKSFHSQEGKTPRSYARFLTAFAELEGEIVLKQLAQLLNQLDSEVPLAWSNIVRFLTFHTVVPHTHRHCRNHGLADQASGNGQSGR
jgi:condensin complex subunit 1